MAKAGPHKRRHGKVWWYYDGATRITKDIYEQLMAGKSHRAPAKRKAPAKKRKAPAKKRVARKRKAAKVYPARAYKRKLKARKRPYKTSSRAPAPGRKKVGYATFRTARKSKRGKPFYKYDIVRTNSPLTSLKKAAMQGVSLAGGLYVARILTGLLAEYVVGKPGDGTTEGSGLLKKESSAATTKSTLVKVAPYLPALGTFLVTTLLAPKLTKKKEYQGVLQMGGVLILVDTLVNQLVVPAIQDSAKNATTQVVDKTSMAYKVSRYIQGASGLSGLEGMEGVYGPSADGIAGMAVYPQFIDDRQGEVGAYVDLVDDAVGLADDTIDPSQAPDDTVYGTSLFDGGYGGGGN
jgi:hypothetical protein